MSNFFLFTFSWQFLFLVLTRTNGRIRTVTPWNKCFILIALMYLYCTMYISVCKIYIYAFFPIPPSLSRTSVEAYNLADCNNIHILYNNIHILYNDIHILYNAFKFKVTASQVRSHLTCSLTLFWICKDIRIFHWQTRPTKQNTVPTRTWHFITTCEMFCF